MGKIKSVFLVVLIVVVVFAAFLWIYSQPKPKPKFEIAELSGYETTGYSYKYYRIVFRIKNVGTGDATIVYGTIKSDNASKETEWRLPLDYVLKSGETSTAVYVSLLRKPNDPSITIVVECYEEVTQQFTEHLPPDSPN